MPKDSINNHPWVHLESPSKPWVNYFETKETDHFAPTIWQPQ